MGLILAEYSYRGDMPITTSLLQRLILRNDSIGTNPSALFGDLWIFSLYEPD